MAHILRFSGLHSCGTSFVSFSAGLVRGIETENFVRVLADGTKPPAKMRLTARYKLADGRIVAYDDMSTGQRAEAVEKVAWLRRECAEKGIEVLA